MQSQIFARKHNKTIKFAPYGRAIYGGVMRMEK